MCSDNHLNKLSTHITIQSSFSRCHYITGVVSFEQAQQRLGELIAELIAVEGPVAIGMGPQTEEEAHTEDYTEEGSQEEGVEPEELSDQDLQLHIVDDDAPCGESARAEEPDRPNPADNLVRPSMASVSLCDALPVAPPCLIPICASLSLPAEEQWLLFVH